MMNRVEQQHAVQPGTLGATVGRHQVMVDAEQHGCDQDQRFGWT